MPRPLPRAAALALPFVALAALSWTAARALLARAGVDRDRVLLTDYRSTEWQSLTFDGERHQIGLRFPGPNASGPVERLLDGLGDAEFTLPGQLLADIAVEHRPRLHPDGAISVGIEALTIAA